MQNHISFHNHACSLVHILIWFLPDYNINPWTINAISNHKIIFNLTFLINFPSRLEYMSFLTFKLVFMIYKKTNSFVTIF